MGRNAGTIIVKRAGKCAGKKGTNTLPGGVNPALPLLGGGKPHPYGLAREIMHTPGCPQGQPLGYGGLWGGEHGQTTAARMRASLRASGCHPFVIRYSIFTWARHALPLQRGQDAHATAPCPYNAGRMPTPRRLAPTTRAGCPRHGRCQDFFSHNLWGS